METAMTPKNIAIESQELVERAAKEAEQSGQTLPELTAQALRQQFGIRAPHVAVCGLNPHAGEQGLFGDEEGREIIPAIDTILSDKNSRIRKETIDPINSGETAGFAVLQLMQKTQHDIPPRDIVELYKQIKGEANVSDQLFEKFGAATSECMARGCLYLAAIWKAGLPLAVSTSLFSQ
jgi:hypothetical protein